MKLSIDLDELEVLYRRIHGLLADGDTKARRLVLSDGGTKGNLRVRHVLEGDTKGDGDTKGAGWVHPLDRVSGRRRLASRGRRKAGAKSRAAAKRRRR